jgi:hypothetical protein
LFYESTDERATKGPGNERAKHRTRCLARPFKHPMADETPKRPPSVYDHLAMMLDQISSVSWQKLGLHPDPITSTVQQNLDEAKVSIDVAAFLVAQLEPKLDDEDRRRVQALIRDLRINFVQKAKEASA